MKLILFLALLGSCLTNFGWGASLNLFGLYNSFHSSGDTSDYIQYENEFPFTDSHLSLGFGLSINNNSRGVFFWGFEADYNLSTTATVTDPTDNDSTEIDTYKNLIGFFTFGLRLIEGKKVSFFIQCGGGGYYILNARSAEYKTKNNFVLEIDPPDRKYGLAGFGGAGIELVISKSIGVIFMGRYLYIASIETQAAIVIQCGLRFVL
jgi:hypothetical protein